MQERRFRDIPLAPDGASGRYQALYLAISMAGHDRGTLYAVMGEDERGLLLCDGRLRTLDRPKYKKKKHVQKITHLNTELEALMKDIRNDADIRSLLRTKKNTVNDE